MKNGPMTMSDPVLFTHRLHTVHHCIPGYYCQPHTVCSSSMGMFLV